MPLAMKTNIPFVHNRTRNWLSLAKAENLVYINTDAWLVWERVDWDLAACYLMNMMSKDFDYLTDKDINDDHLLNPT